MKNRKNFALILAILILGLVIWVNFSTGKELVRFNKRGYILDRKGEPLVLNKLRHSAYFLMKGRSPLGEGIPKEIEPYLSSILDLPEKGLIFLSDSLSEESIKELNKVKNVVINTSIERKILFKGLTPLIGMVRGEEGIFGIERAFDEKLKRGEALLLSIDTTSLKKIYNIINSFWEIKNVAIFDVSKGELLGYYSSQERDFLVDFYYIPKNAYFERISPKVEWLSNSYEVKEKGEELILTPLHLAKSLLKSVCQREIDFSVIFPRDSLCEVKEDIEEKRVFIGGNRWLVLILKKKHLFLFTGEVKEEFRDNYNWENLIKNLVFLSQNF